MKKEENTGIIAEFTYNKNGVRIKKCCASCATHEPYDQQGPRRICTYNRCNKVVQKDDLCKHWSINMDIDRIRVNGQGL